MPFTTLTAAKDEILLHFKTEWDAAVIAQPYVNAPLFYDDVANDLPTTGPFLRLTLRHDERSGQRTMGESGTRRFTRVGTLTIQIFTPLGDGGTLSDLLTDIVLGILEGRKSAADGVWFRNTTFREVGVSDAWWQMNVLTDFEYDAIK